MSAGAWRDFPIHVQQRQNALVEHKFQRINTVFTLDNFRGIVILTCFSKGHLEQAKHC